MSWTEAILELGSSSNLATAKDDEEMTAGFSCAEGTRRTVLIVSPSSSIFTISKVICKSRGVCGAWQGAKRIVTTREVGFSCRSRISKVGVSCIEPISIENVN